MKTIFLLVAALAVTASAAEIRIQSSNVYACDENKMINLVKSIPVQIKGGLFQTVSEAVRIPSSGVLQSPITCLVVKNLGTESNAGYVTVDGGLGSLWADIRITSKWSKGIDYNIEVYTE